MHFFIVLYEPGIKQTRTKQELRMPPVVLKICTATFTAALEMRFKNQSTTLGSVVKPDPYLLKQKEYIQ
jgi:hypothetical protein